jgi:hypothetical protein
LTGSERKTPLPFWRAPPNLPAKGRDIINLGIGQPDFKTPEHIVEAAIKALRDGHHGYTPANGLLQAREAVCRRTHDHDRHRDLARQRHDHAGRQADHVCRHSHAGRAGVSIFCIPTPAFRSIAR